MELTANHIISVLAVIVAAVSHAPVSQRAKHFNECMDARIELYGDAPADRVSHHNKCNGGW